MEARSGARIGVASKFRVSLPSSFIEIIQLNSHRKRRPAKKAQNSIFEIFFQENFPLRGASNFHDGSPKCLNGWFPTHTASKPTTDKFYRWAARITHTTRHLHTHRFHIASTLPISPQLHQKTSPGHRPARFCRRFAASSPHTPLRPLKRVHPFTAQ